MAGLNSTLFSLVDATKVLKPDGTPETKIAELLAQTNPMLQDIPWKEGNLATGERITIRTGYPTGVWRKFNVGVPNSKSTNAQVDETCAMYEQKGQIDKDLAMLNGATSEFRLIENMAHIEAMNIDMAQALFYSDPSQPEKFVGLTPRYSSTTAGNGQNVILAGGAQSDNTSIWLIGFGEIGVYGIYPKGSQGGLKHTPVQDGTGDGCTEVLDENGNTYRAYVDRYQWKCGVAVKDWRYAVRVANIDLSDLLGLTGTQALTASTNIIKLMSRAIDRIPSPSGVKLAFYMSRSVFSALKLMALEKSSSALSIEEAVGQFGGIGGKELKFLGIPVRLSDGISHGEALVS